MNTKTIFDLMNKTEHLNSRSVLRSIRILYLAMVTGLLSFLAVTFLISQDFKFVFDKSDPIIFANLILFLLAIPAGYLASQFIWRKIEKKLLPKDKLLKYQPLLHGMQFALALLKGSPDIASGKTSSPYCRAVRLSKNLLRLLQS